MRSKMDLFRGEPVRVDLGTTKDLDTDEEIPTWWSDDLVHLTFPDHLDHHFFPGTLSSNHAMELMAIAIALESVPSDLRIAFYVKNETIFEALDYWGNHETQRISEAIRDWTTAHVDLLQATMDLIQTRSGYVHFHLLSPEEAE